MKRSISISLIAFFLVWSIAFIAVKLPFMGPISEAIKEFEMTDTYYQILQDTDDEDDAEVSDAITIVDITELYSRRELAQTLDNIMEQHPKVVGVDVVFEGLKEDTVGDRMMAEVALTHDNIVFSEKLLDYKDENTGFTDMVHSFFAEEPGTVNEGITNMPRNLYGGIKRKMQMGWKVQGEMIPSFISMVSAMYQGSDSIVTADKTLNINFVPKHFPILLPDSVAAHPELIKGRAILFGTMKDEYDMHYTPLGKMPGTQLLAYAIDTVIKRSEVKEVNGWLMALLSFLLVLLTQYSFARYKTFAAGRKNRFARFVMSMTLIKSYLTFIWIALWMWVAFMIFYLYDIQVDIGWALSAIAFLALAESIYDEVKQAINNRKK